MQTPRPALIALTAALTLGVTACGSDTPVAPASSTSSSSSAADSSTSSDDASESATDDATSSSSTASSSTSASKAAASRPKDVLAAIDAAEKKVGGTAYEIDDQDDDGTWEIDVVKGSKSFEVTVTADGRATTDDESDDLDDDDRAGLKAAKISVGEAIESALKEADGTFDDAELEEEDGKHFWVVTIDTKDRDDVQIRVDVVTGKATVDSDG